MAKRPDFVAVLTGDLIGSRRLSADQLAVVRSVFAEIAGDLQGWDATLLLGGPQFFRGDSWQLALRDPRLALRAAIAIRARLRKQDMDVDTRVSIGIGAVERINTDEISISVGDAFTRSGLGLDKMGSDRAIRVEAAQVEHLFWLSAMLSLCSDRVGDWKPGQAAAALARLDPRGGAQKTIAQKLGVTPQTVSAALAGARIESVLEAIAVFETLDWRALAKRARML